MVASKHVTVVDNGNIPSKRGSLNIDDEGTPTQETVLIENGILKQYMFDIINATLMNSKSTGNGRRQSFAHIPMPRMTNTYMTSSSDSYTHDEIISSIDYGVYAESLKVDK